MLWFQWLVFWFDTWKTNGLTKKWSQAAGCWISCQVLEGISSYVVQQFHNINFATNKNKDYKTEESLDIIVLVRPQQVEQTHCLFHGM